MSPFARRLDSSSPAPIAVAFSGGPDSYLALRQTIAATARPVVALHVDHGLNPSSGAWAEKARALAQALGAGFRLLRWEGDKPATGLPAAARAARHALLADAARALGAKVIVTGHTGDDALENRILGQGALSEWSPSPAWPQGRGLFLLRPLLQRRRQEIRDELADVLPSLVDDPANADQRHPRIAARAALAGKGGLPSEDGASVPVEGVDLPASGAILFPRSLAGPRLLAAAAAAAGGKPGVPRRARVERLLRGMAADGPLSATLAGARILARGDEIAILRDAGETARGGLAPLRLAPWETAVFDGRFEMTAGAGPIEVRPLKGLAAQLPAAERRALSAIPAAARPSLPLIATGSQVSCPILASVGGTTVRPLVGARFLAACGAIAHEGLL